MIEHILDEYAQANALRDFDTRFKLLLGAGAILICVFSENPFAPLFIAFSMVLITVGIARIPVRIYLLTLIGPLTFAILSAFVILLITGGVYTAFWISLGGYNFSVTTEALHLASLVLARTLGGMCGLFFIAFSTPVVELFSVMRSLHLPREFIDLSMLIYRFIFILLGEAIAIRNAQLMRHGYSGFRNSLRSFSLLSSMLFIRAWDRGDGLLTAMDSRCYDGKFELPKKEDRNPTVGALLIAGYLAIGVSILLMMGQRGFI